MNKISPKKIQRIVKDYRENGGYLHELAKRHGIGESTACRILNENLVPTLNYPPEVLAMVESLRQKRYT